MKKKTKTKKRIIGWYSLYCDKLDKELLKRMATIFGKNRIAQK